MAREEAIFGWPRRPGFTIYRPPDMAAIEANILADSGPDIGLGHLRRSMVLATAFAAAGARVRLLTPDEEAQRMARQAVADTAPWPEDWRDLPAGDVIIVDSYRIAADSVRQWRPWFRLRVSIDDLADHVIDADIIINPNSYGDTLNYRDICHCTILAGPDYALVDPAFAELRRLRRSDGRRVLIAFGGTDDGTLGAAAAAALLRRSDVTIDLVASPLCPVGAAAQALARAESGRLRLHHGASMTDLMAKAVLYLGACGSTVWEASAAGLGLVVARTADNQALAQIDLARRGLAAFETFEAERMAEAAAVWLAAPTPNPLSTAIDGRGAARAVEAILALLTDKIAAV